MCLDWFSIGEIYCILITICSFKQMADQDAWAVATFPDKNTIAITELQLSDRASDVRDLVNTYLSSNYGPYINPERVVIRTTNSRVIDLLEEAGFMSDGSTLYVYKAPAIGVKRKVSAFHGLPKHMRKKVFGVAKPKFASKKMFSINRRNRYNRSPWTKQPNLGPFNTIEEATLALNQDIEEVRQKEKDGTDDIVLFFPVELRVDMSRHPMMVSAQAFTDMGFKDEPGLKYEWRIRFRITIIRREIQRRKHIVKRTIRNAMTGDIIDSVVVGSYNLPHEAYDAIDMSIAKTRSMYEDLYRANVTDVRGAKRGVRKILVNVPTETFTREISWVVNDEMVTIFMSPKVKPIGIKKTMNALPRSMRRRASRQVKKYGPRYTPRFKNVLRFVIQKRFNLDPSWDDDDWIMGCLGPFDTMLEAKDKMEEDIQREISYEREIMPEVPDMRVFRSSDLWPIKAVAYNVNKDDPTSPHENGAWYQWRIEKLMVPTPEIVEQMKYVARRQVYELFDDGSMQLRGEKTIGSFNHLSQSRRAMTQDINEIKQVLENQLSADISGYCGIPGARNDFSFLAKIASENNYRKYYWDIEDRAITIYAKRCRQ